MLPVLAIILFNMVLYFPTIFYDLVMDDTNLFAHRKKYGFIPFKWGHSFNYYKQILEERTYGGTTFSANPQIEHGVTISLWISLCVLIYYAFGHNNISLATALLVSCHPLMNQLSIWLNGRRYLICAIILMICLICGPWSLPIYLLSYLFQVTIFFTPVLFILKNPFFLLSIGLLFFLLKDYLKVKIKERCALIPCNDLKIWNNKRIIIIIKIFGFYIFKILIPQRVQMVYPFLQMFGRTKEGMDNAYEINGDFFKGLAAVGIVGAIIYFVPVNYKPWGIFMALSILQWCAVLAVTQLVADRYAAIGTIFMCFFISYFSLTFLPISVAIGLLCLLAGAYLVHTIQVFPMYKNLTAWYDYHVYDDFSNIGVIPLRIGILLAERKIWQAQALIENALSYYPNDYAVHYLGYVCCMSVGAIPLAQQHLEICKKNIYLGEEQSRQQELLDAELGLRLMAGQRFTNSPQSTVIPKKG